MPSAVVMRKSKENRRVQIPYRKTRDGVLIEVRVEPRSSAKEIAGVIGNRLKVRLTAPPVDGAANKQLIEVLSEETGIKKSSITILKGLSSREKLVEIKGVESV